MLVDTCAAGGSVFMQLPYIAAAAFHHQTFSVKVHRIDSCPTKYVVSVAAHAGEPIVDNHTGTANGIPCGNPNGICKIDIPGNSNDLTMWTDGARWIVIDIKGF